MKIQRARRLPPLPDIDGIATPDEPFRGRMGTDVTEAVRVYRPIAQALADHDPPVFGQPGDIINVRVEERGPYGRTVRSMNYLVVPHDQTDAFPTSLPR